MGMAVLLSSISITVYFTSNQAFGMLYLSRQYAAAATTAQQWELLAAGEALLAKANPGAAHSGTGAYIAFFLILLAGLIISLIMLPSARFTRTTGWMGILANGIGLLYFPVLIIAPVLNWLPPTTSAPFRLIWYILIIRTLFQLGRNQIFGELDE
jgi:hypothetical protein